MTASVNEAANRTPSQSQSEDQSQTQNPSPAPTWATERTHATTALVAATRSLMHAAATTDLPVDDLATARRAIESVTAELSARARDRVLRIPFDLPAQVRAAGPEAEWNTYALNPFGIPVRVTFDDETSRGSFVPGALHEGPPDSLHGGWSAHLMDCMLGGLVQATGARAVTATLELSYRHRVPLDSEVSMEATITRREGRKIFAEGWIEHDGVRCVEATGLFIRVDGISVDGVAS